MLRKPSRSSGKELLLHSLLDLLYRDVLYIYKEWRYPSKSSLQKRLYTFVKRGANFENYDPSRDEKVITHFFGSESNEYQLRVLVKRIVQALPGGCSGYKSELLVPHLKIIGICDWSFWKYHKLDVLGQQLARELNGTLLKARGSLNPKHLLSIDQLIEQIHEFQSAILLSKRLNGRLILKARKLYKNYNIESLDNSTLSKLQFLLFFYEDVIRQFHSSFIVFKSRQKEDHDYNPGMWF